MTGADRAAAARVDDWTALPLAPGGRRLIEASAGTGKTWTIAVLYLRVLLEPMAPDGVPLTPRQIIVTTFTDAAAQELRARLRAQLVRAERLAARMVADPESAPSGEANADEVWLFTRWHSDRQGARQDLQRLRLALAELDMAPITTLHGLCRRILGDYPFESGSAFGLGELVSSDSVLTELAQDLWRCLQQGDEAVPEWKSVATLAAMTRRLKLCLSPGVGLWRPDEQELDRMLYREMAQSLQEFAARDGIWSATPKGKQSSTLRNAMLALAEWVLDRQAVPGKTALDHLADRAEQLDPAQRDALLAEPAMRHVATALRCLGYAMNEAEIVAWQHWTEQVRSRRNDQLAASNRLTFDDLLARVSDALEGDTHLLADRLFADWKLALVDEFQDTDALQYSILDRIFRDATGAPRGCLVMIGDPKQAIYRFRGGDISTYLAASRAVDAQLALDINRRSSQSYIAAINELFERAGGGLSAAVNSAIRVESVSACKRCDAAPYRGPGDEAEHPLVLHYNDGDVPTAAGERRSLALTACANQIAMMLAQANHFIGDQPVRPDDIAVLLPTHVQVVELRALLQARGVSCVGSGRSSVFEIEWARELQIALYAVEHATEDSAVRAALATRLGGATYAELLELDGATEAWQRHATRFANLKHRWQRDGVLAVVLSLAHDALAGEPDPDRRERSLTDLRHLGELLQARSEQVHGAVQLLIWFAAQIDGDGDAEGEAADERQLRIESDAKRVRLMTLHASKGLEFPIVFLPLMWDHIQKSHDTVPVIDEPLCNRRVIGFGSEARAQYDRAGQDERFHVLYVALTRAIHACHVYVLPPQRAKDAGTTKVPTDPARSALDALVERLLEREPDPSRLRSLKWSSDAWSWPRMHFTPDVASSAGPIVVLNEPPRSITESMWSFSALTSQRGQSSREDEAADDEMLANAVVNTGEPGLDIATDQVSDIDTSHPALAELSALRGVEFGNALHAIFENRAIGTPLAAQPDLITRALREAGVRIVALATGVAVARIAARVDAVLAAQLAPDLCLGALPARQLRAEMAFHFALDEVSVKRLREACVRHGEAGLVPDQLPVATLRGFMTGKIDLVFEHGGCFHVLDYKGNYLGDRLDDYAPERLGAAMDEHHYRFQALIYTVALDRYLRQRIDGYRRETHLGDAIYLFVRAVGLAPGAGTWRHRFDAGLLDAVDRAFAATSALVST